MSKRSCNKATNAINAYLYSYLIDISSAIIVMKITSALMPFSVISWPKVGPTLWKSISEVATLNLSER